MFLGSISSEIGDLNRMVDLEIKPVTPLIGAEIKNIDLRNTLNKEEIFELYVNRIFLGNRSYGIEAAANTYFNKSVNNLSLSESATIAAMAQLPSKINPIKIEDRTDDALTCLLYTSPSPRDS